MENNLNWKKKINPMQKKIMAFTLLLMPKSLAILLEIQSGKRANKVTQIQKDNPSTNSYIVAFPFRNFKERLIINPRKQVFGKFATPYKMI